jgi:hypothetical protein
MPHWIFPVCVLAIASLVFTPTYLRASKCEDKSWILTQNKVRGFSGMLGWVDYMHWIEIIVRSLGREYSKLMLESVV